MNLVFVILSLVGLLTFLALTILANKNKKGKIQIPMIGSGIFLVLFIGALFLNNSSKDVIAPKEVKTVVKPVETKKPEEPKKKTEDQPNPTDSPKIKEKEVNVVHGPGSKVKGPGNLNYVMNVTYDSKNHVISGSMSVDFINNLDVNLTNLYFNVWANAVTYLEKTKKDANVVVNQIKVNSQPVNYTLEGTALHIPQVSIKKNEKAKVEMNFSVTLPETEDRFGWNNTTTSLGNWFPILAVYDNEGWNVDPFFPYGESFYSLTSNFAVTLTTEKEQVIATTGTEVGKPKINGALATHQYRAVDVRDFAMEMDPAFKIKQTKAGNVNINVYYKDEHAKYVDKALSSGAKSIELFSQKFGQYPWPELDICMMEGWFGGMEYPQLVMESIHPDNPIDVEHFGSIVSHEIGHQWFYGVIGNNEYDEPWLDESFATFAQAMADGSTETVYMKDRSKLGDSHLSSTIRHFTENINQGNPNYSLVIYTYGCETLDDLRKELGDAQFYASMQAYFKEMKFGVSTTADFIRIMEQTSKKDLSKFFEDHLVYISDQQ